MTSISERLDYLEALQGVDVTHELGRYRAARERLDEANVALQDKITIERVREYAAAYDAFWALFVSTGEEAA